MYSKSFFWLAKRIGVEPRLFESVINDLKQERQGKRPSAPLYQVIVFRQNDKKRKIHIPSEELKEIQERINRRILAKLPVNSNVFGFSGGNIEGAIKPHFEYPSLWTCDIKDAFSSIFEEWVFSALRFYFSISVARLLTLLTTAPPACRLPQGAPTSPRLFDLCMKVIDRELSKIAEEIDGKYTRYADNIFLSAGEEKLREAEKEILSLFRMAELIPHKIKIKNLEDSSAVKLLGLNVIEKRIHNTRSFKRQLRLLIHHINWLLAHQGGETTGLEKAWKQLQGKMAGFARWDTLSPKLIENYLVLKKRLT